MRRLLAVLTVLALVVVVALRSTGTRSTGTLFTQTTASDAAIPAEAESTALVGVRANGDTNASDAQGLERAVVPLRPTLTLACQDLYGTAVAGIELELGRVGAADRLVTRSSEAGIATFADLEPGLYEVGPTSHDFVSGINEPIEVFSSQRIDLPLARMLAAVVRYEGLTVLGDTLSTQYGDAVGIGVRNGRRPWPGERVRRFLELRFPESRVYLLGDTPGARAAAKYPLGRLLTPSGSTTRSRSEPPDPTVRAFTSEAGWVSAAVKLLPPESIEHPTLVRAEPEQLVSGQLRVDVHGPDGVQVPLGFSVIARSVGVSSPATRSLTGAGISELGDLWEQPPQPGAPLTLPHGAYTVRIPPLPGRLRGPNERKAEVIAGETTVITFALEQALYPFRFEAWSGGQRVEREVLADVRCNGKALFRILQANLHEPLRWLPAGDLEVTAGVHDLGSGTTSFTRTVAGFDEQLVVIQLVD